MQPLDWAKSMNDARHLERWVVEAGAIGLSALEEVTGYCAIDSPNGKCRLDATPHGNLPQSLTGIDIDLAYQDGKSQSKYRTMAQGVKNMQLQGGGGEKAGTLLLTLTRAMYAFFGLE